MEQCDLTPSHEIGAGQRFSTPLAGQVVSVRGVVVGDVPGLGGFYLQDDGDADAATSDGIFVATSTAVGLGDTVAVAGTASENFGETRITPGEVDVQPGLRGEPPAATPLDLPAGSAAREPLEGMLVAPVDTLTVSEVFNLTRFGELMLRGRAAGAADRAGRRRLAGGHRHRRRERAAQDRARRRHQRQPQRDQPAIPEPGHPGPGRGRTRLHISAGARLRLRQLAVAARRRNPDGTFAPQNTRPAAPDPVGGDVQIGAFNVLNYFLTLAADGGAVPRHRRSSSARPPRS